jgi:hypothetical protein
MLVSHHIKKYKFYLGLGLVILFSILIALRDVSIGSDAGNYYSLVTNPDKFSQKIEPIMYVIAGITRELGGGSFLFFFIISLLMNFLLYLTYYKIDNKNYIIYIIFLSVSFLFLNANVNILRQAIAIGFVFLSMYYLVYFKIYRYLFFSLIAVFVHSSAIVILIMPIFLYLNSQKIIVYFVGILLGLIISDFAIVDLLYYIKDFHWIIDRLYWYMTWDKITPFNLKHVYFLYIIVFILYIYKYNSLDMIQKRFFSIFLSLFFIIVLFKIDDFLVDRFSFYYIPLVVYLYFNLITIYKFKQKQFVLAMFILFPFLWIFKTAYQHNLWWILGEIR